MFKSVFAKTLFEKRWAIIAWSAALFAANFLMIQLFPPLRDAFADMMTNIPPALQGWFGSGEIWSTMSGFVSSQVFGQMATVMIVFGIIFANSIFAAEEKSGVLLTQLARPIKREYYFLQKFSALIVATISVAIFYLLGAWFGTVVLSYTVPITDLLVPGIALILLTLSFASIALGIGAATGRGTLAAIVVGFYATVFYFVSTFGVAAPILETISKFSPFYWYGNPMSNGLPFWHVIALVDFIIVPIVVGLVVFARRDLKTQ